MSSMQDPSLDEHLTPEHVRDVQPSALCRCGQSNNKPFCDSAHRQIGFRTDPLSAPTQPP